MRRLKSFLLTSLALAVFALTWGVDQGWAQSAKSDKELWAESAKPQKNKELKFRGGRLTTAERNAAAKRAKELGLKPGVAGLAAQAPEPGGAR